MSINLLSIRGRLRRTHYVTYTAVAALITNILVGAATLLDDIPAAVVALSLISLNIWISFCLSVQRSHDRGQGPAQVIIIYGALLTGLAMLVGSILLMFVEGTFSLLVGAVGIILVGVAVILSGILTFAPPTNGPNQFGADPRG